MKSNAIFAFRTVSAPDRRVFGLVRVEDKEENIDSCGNLTMSDIHSRAVNSGLLILGANHPLLPP
jgi:hypothetical protein